MAFQLQPRLRASLESIRQAQGREDIAFAAYLPSVSAAYSVGGYDLRAGGTVPLPSSSAFNFFPGVGAIPVGLDIQTGYELAELKLQWLICDFGRRTGAYHQAGLAEEIAKLQTERAYQTVINDVSNAYYQVLRVQALHRIAEEFRRAVETDRNDAVKLLAAASLKMKRCSAQRLPFPSATTAPDVAEEERLSVVAALNLAIGLNICLKYRCRRYSERATFYDELPADRPQSAISSRREFQIAHQSVQVAAEGGGIAKADRQPRIVGGGYLNNFQQASPRGDADLGVGFIRLDWGLSKVKRIAERKVNRPESPRSHGRVGIDCRYHRLSSQSGLPSNGCGAKRD